MNLKGTYSGITKSGLAGRQLLAGDFNGDGKFDFLISPVQGNNSDIWEKHYVTTQFEGTSVTMTEHKFRWYERSANRHARKYFKSYGVDWDELIYPIRDRR